MIRCQNPRCPSNPDGHCARDQEVCLDHNGRCDTAVQINQESLDEILRFLQRFCSYPFDDDKDHEFFSEILQDFPELDLLEHLKDFQAWILDRDDLTKINYRSSIRKWMKRAQEKNI